MSALRVASVALGGRPGWIATSGRVGSVPEGDVAGGPPRRRLLICFGALSLLRVAAAPGRKRGERRFGGECHGADIVLRAAGDLAGAQEASRKALNWAIASALIGPILVALWFFLFGGLALLGGLSGM